MANRYLCAGIDLGMIRVGAGIPTTNTADFNSTYADQAVQCGSSGVNFFVDFVDSAGASDNSTSGETVWARATIQHDVNNTTQGTILAMVNGSDQPWLAVRTTSTSGQWGLFYNSNTGASPTWTQIGSNFALTSSVVRPFVLSLTQGSPHSAALYMNGVSVASGTFTQASLTEIHALYCGNNHGGSVRFSEVLGSIGINLVGSNVFYGKPSGAGSNSGWTGASTTVDDVGVDDTDFATSTSAGQKTTWAYSNVPTVGAGIVAGDLFAYTRCKNDGASPTNIKPVRRSSGGTDNVGSSFSGVGAGFSEQLVRYSGITITEYNASEFGVESAA